MFRSAHATIALASALVFIAGSTAASAADPGSAAAGAKPATTEIAIPGAGPGGLALDYLVADRDRGRVWVPAGGTGTVAVIDAKTQQVTPVGKFATAEVERQGTKRVVGPSSATVGDGVVYIGNRGDASVCAVDAVKLVVAGCVTLAGSPDGVAYVASRKEVWVTTPRDASIVILDVSVPSTPKVAGTIKLDGAPEGYAVDDAHGVFYTNLEDKDRTLRIDAATRKVTATWNAGCGENGPRGLAIEPAGQLLMLACTDHVEVLDAGKDGRILSKLETGDGVDNLDYLPARHLLYAAAGRAGTLTIARVGTNGTFAAAGTVTTAKGARNAVVTAGGVVYIADGGAGKVLVLPTAVK